MLLKDLMTGLNPDADYEGWVTNDDFVIACDISETQDAIPGDYAVAQTGVAGLDAQLNPTTEEKIYIRAGQSSQKTSTQRTFAITGDRYIGDAFQDFVFSHAIKFGTGNSVIVKYVYFNMKNGKGEQGEVTVIVNSDGAGNAGESSAIDIALNKVAANPADYAWTPPTP